jgi:hypothetical protein
MRKENKVWIRPTKGHTPCFPRQPEKKLTKHVEVDLFAHEMWWGRELRRGNVELCDSDGQTRKEKKKTPAEKKAIMKGGK